MNGMFQGEGSLASSQQGSSGIMSKPAKEEAKPEKEEAKPEKTPVSFNFQGEGGEDNNSDNTDSGTVVTNKEVDDVIAEYKLPTVLTGYNNTVKNLQTYLNATPIAPGLSTDGRWGAKTSAAVADFKKYKDELYKRTGVAFGGPLTDESMFVPTPTGKLPKEDNQLKPILRPQKLMDSINKEPYWTQNISKVNKPIFSDATNASGMVLDTANKTMVATLEGPFKLLDKFFEETYGKNLIINDAIAKSNTIRKSNTSRHFHGDALDISIRGLSNEEIQNLVVLAEKAGFKGFGFGNNILHADTGDKRSWTYTENGVRVKTFGGVDVDKMIGKYKRPAKK